MCSFIAQGNKMTSIFWILFYKWKSHLYGFTCIFHIKEWNSPYFGPNLIPFKHILKNGFNYAPALKHKINARWLTNPNHNIIKIHNNVLWDWRYYVEYSIIQFECEEYFTKYCQSYITLLWILIMLWLCP